MIDAAATRRLHDGPAGEDPVDLRRYLSGLRRSWLLMLAMVVAATGTAVALSLSAEKSYRTTARLALVESGTTLTDDGVTRRLVTVATLMTTPGVLGVVAQGQPGESAASLRDRVTASADAGASVVDVSATASSAARAATIANTVAQVFLEREQRRAAARTEGARKRLLTELRGLGNSPIARQQARAIREQLSALAVTEATTESEFELVEPALASRADVSPRPLRNGLLALMASLFLAVLVALGRDQLVPRVSGPRELSLLLGLPVLAKIPPHRFALRRRPRAITGAEHAAYEVLQALLTNELPPDRQKIILVTSARAGEGKTRVVAGLGRALANDGHDTLLVSGDLRLPRLHEHFDLPLLPGLAELLTDHLVDGRPPDAERVEGMLTNSLVGARGAGTLRLLSSGKPEVSPSRLLAADLVGQLFQEINRLQSSYVLIDSPPLLGIADTQNLMHCCDALIVVARPSQISIETASDLREVLDRTKTPALGLVVTGVPPSDAGSYYYGGR